MKNSSLSLPEQKNYEHAYNLAYKLAREKLVKIDDIEQQCRKSSAQYQIIDSQPVIIVEYLNRSYQITLPDVKLSLADSEEEVPIRDKLLILHYFILAKGTPPANRLITFRELPEGNTYFPTFSKRAIKPLIDHFGKDPSSLVDISAKLGGRKADYGDVAVIVNAFSRVPITIILWQGDDELAPQGNIVFDATISDYLSTEDITVLCEIIAWRLAKLLREGSAQPSGS